jgi:hypothetical protein
MKKRKNDYFLSINYILQTIMVLQPYRFRLKTSPETFTLKNKISHSNNILLYFKGEQGLTQTLTIPLNKLNENVYEKSLELLDVGNVNRANVFINLTFCF